MLAYREAGERTGKPLVLVHGFPLDGRAWDAVAQEIERLGGWRVIVPDLPGFGRSAGLIEQATQPVTMERMADDLRGLVDHLNIARAAWAGLSMGGYVLLTYLRRHGHTVGELALVDTRASGDNAEGKAGREKMAALALSAGSRAVADQMFPKMLSGGHAPEAASRLMEIMTSQTPSGIASACLAMRDRADFTADLPGIKVPVKVIVGRDDVITNVATAQAVADAVPGARLTIIEGAGHMAPIERPVEVARALVG